MAGGGDGAVKLSDLAVLRRELDDDEGELRREVRMGKMTARPVFIDLDWRFVIGIRR